jgi:hypothetical protein
LAEIKEFFRLALQDALEQIGEMECEIDALQSEIARLKLSPSTEVQPAPADYEAWQKFAAPPPQPVYPPVVEIPATPPSAFPWFSYTFQYPATF